MAWVCGLALVFGVFLLICVFVLFLEETLHFCSNFHTLICFRSHGIKVFFFHGHAKTE